MAVLGHNGSGKSTLAKHFNAILLPTSGTVFVDGIDTKEEDRLYDIRQTAGMVFQNPDNQLVATIVEEDVALRWKIWECLRRRSAAGWMNRSKRWACTNTGEHSPHQLSGGQKQRVAIAGIIAMRPKCIVLDEPTAMLDPQGRREVLRTIRELGNQFGITVVLITHYMDEAAQCDRVVVMDNGKIILDGVPRAVFSHVEQLKNVGLDVPQVTELAWLLLQDDYCLPDDIIFEEECVRPLKNCWRNAMSVIKTEHLTHTYSQGTSYEQAAVSDVTWKSSRGR